jgi:hypothetical protein
MLGVLPPLELKGADAETDVTSAFGKVLPGTFPDPSS